MSNTLEFLSCHGIKSPDYLATKLRKRFSHIETESMQGRWCYLDTFDWRLYNQNWVLETFIERSGVQLIWRELNTRRIRAVLWRDKLPVFAQDLPKGSHWLQLGQILEMRALMPLACYDLEDKQMILRNGESKAVVHLDVRQREDDSEIRLTEVRGFGKEFQRTLDWLEKKFHCKKIKTDPVLERLQREQRKPGSYQRKPPSQNNPNLRSDQVCKTILRHLLDVMEENEPGMRKQIDSEFLHDFRVAVRRSRSLLTQVKAVFPHSREQRFRRELTWLQEVTGPARDMDVYLLDFPHLQAELPPEQRENLLSLGTFLIAVQQDAHKNLSRALDSQRYRNFIRDWRTFLEAPEPRYTSLANAAQPIGKVAAAGIWKLFRRAIRQGEAITDASPADDMHELRKTCKKLRYLLEFFEGLFPPKEMSAMVKALKVLQDNLGTYQDLQVQQESLVGFKDSMAEQGLSTHDTREAIQALIELFGKREKRVRSEFPAHFQVFSSRDNKKHFKNRFHKRSKP